MKFSRRMLLTMFLTTLFLVGYKNSHKPILAQELDAPATEFDLSY